VAIAAVSATTDADAEPDFILTAGAIDGSDAAVAGAVSLAAEAVDAAIFDFAASIDIDDEGVAMAVDEAENIVAARGDDAVGDGNVGVGNVGVGGGGGEGYHEYESEMRTRMDKGGLPYAILNNQLLKAMTMQTKTAYDDSVRRQR
jgi:hypothetical protein